MIHRISLFVFVLLLASGRTSLVGAELKVGHGTCDITPPRPVALAGQHRARLSTEAVTPIQANILALEGSFQGKTTRAIFVAVDIVGMQPLLDVPLRKALKKTLPDLGTNDIVFCATHTHTAPALQDRHYKFPEGTEYMRSAEYIPFAVEKLAPAVTAAWESRQPAKFSYGLDFAIVAYNRRAVYADGTAVMYGKTNRSDFRGMEGMEDHDLGTMFFWDMNDKLLAVFIDISCPAQEVESLSVLHADFWHPVREGIKAKYGDDVTVIGLPGAAGDVSPHTQYRKVAEDRMSKLRDLTRIEEMARRIIRAVDDTYEAVKADKKTDVPFRHEFEMVVLPELQVTKEESEAAEKEIAKLEKELETNPRAPYRIAWFKGAISRYKKQQTKPDELHDYPVHILRIGDAAIITNPFELFTAYGVQMKARCKAVQTFVVQLADGGRVDHRKGYVPTVDAYRHGGYGAVPQSVFIGPEGAQILVEESLERTNALFP